MKPYPIRKPNMISTNQWSRFFTSVAEQQVGEAVRVERGVASVSPATILHSGTLESLHYQSSRGARELSITIQGEQSQRITIKPTLVWGIYDTDNRLVAVEITDDNDRSVTLKFEGNS